MSSVLFVYKRNTLVPIPNKEYQTVLYNLYICIFRVLIVKTLIFWALSASSVKSPKLLNILFKNRKKDCLVKKGIPGTPIRCACRTRIEQNVIKLKLNNYSEKVFDDSNEIICNSSFQLLYSLITTICRTAVITLTVFKGFSFAIK